MKFIDTIARLICITFKRYDSTVAFVRLLGYDDYASEASKHERVRASKQTAYIIHMLMQMRDTLHLYIVCIF